MIFEKILSEFFGNSANGIILDNCYDPYLKNRYIDYANKNNINYLRCVDTDMNLLSNFCNIEFLAVSQDAYNLQAIYKLKNLKGIEICSKELEQLDLTNFNNLEYLCVIGGPKNTHSVAQCKSIKHLRCDKWTLDDLETLIEFNNLESLQLSFCSKLKSLSGIEKLNLLQKLTIDYCLKLRDVSQLAETKSHLKVLEIIDCNRIEDLSVLQYLINLNALRLFSFETQVTNSFSSVKFVRELKKLEEFTTDYKIEDKDLTPLVNVEKVELFKVCKSYN